MSPKVSDDLGVSFVRSGGPVGQHTFGCPTGRSFGAAIREGGAHVGRFGGAACSAPVPVTFPALSYTNLGSIAGSIAGRRQAAGIRDGDGG